MAYPQTGVVLLSVLLFFVALGVAGMLLLIPSSLLPGDSVSTYIGIALAGALVVRDRFAVRNARAPAHSVQ